MLVTWQHQEGNSLCHLVHPRFLALRQMRPIGSLSSTKDGRRNLRHMSQSIIHKHNPELGNLWLTAVEFPLLNAWPNNLAFGGANNSNGGRVAMPIILLPKRQENEVNAAVDFVKARFCIDKRFSYAHWSSNSETALLMSKMLENEHQT